MPQALHVVGGADRLLGGVHVAGLVREQQQHLHAAVLGVEILGAQLGVVEHLGADLGRCPPGRADAMISVSGKRPGVAPCRNQATSAWPVRAKS